MKLNLYLIITTTTLLITFSSCDKDEDNNSDNTSVSGCTNSEALNYNPNATIDDGSCIYDTSNLDEEINLEINVFPNPNNGTFNIILNENLIDFEIEIINILGQIVHKEFIENYIINSTKKIDLQLTEGTYIVKVKNEENNIQLPIIVE